MQTYLFIAGSLALLVGVVHSVLGERLIFSRMRTDGLIPTSGAPVLKERHVRIMWASWHIVSVFGWALGAMLLRRALPSTDFLFEVFVTNTIAASMLVSSFLVLISTKGMHPGWLALLGVAVLTWLG
jgi:drug/metabolite transporter (DMT)-like permease